ncbi:MAG: PP2C family protein-serine/threonine phosphatase [Candidatus Marinamargulisbacteria bacterium]
MVPILITSLVFLGVNLVAMVTHAPYFVYPISAMFSFIIFIYIYIVSLQKEASRLTDEINDQFIDTLPKKRLMKDLTMAKHVQQALLQVESPHILGVNIAKKCVPADNVGGDFYSFICRDFDEMTAMHRSPGIVKYVPHDHQYLGVVIGDVAGHGVSSALIMALSAGLFSEVGKRYPSPKNVLTAINKDIRRYIENSRVTHVTAFYGVLNTATHMFTYCRAGHPGIILQRADNELTELETDGTFLGMFNDVEFTEAQIQLKKGDRLFFYTDGITEAKGPNGQLFGTERLMEHIKLSQQHPIGTVLHHIFDTVDAYTQHQKSTDDRSLVVLEISPC